jgi:hypothetical protein
MLIIPVGYPNTFYPGSEITGYGLDPATGTLAVSPNGTSGTVAALRVLVNATLASGKSAFAISRNSNF